MADDQSLLNVLTTVGQVTLLGAILTSGGLIVAADGASLDIGIEGGEATIAQELVTKLWRIREEPLVWGYAGEGVTGQPFGDWLTRQQFTDWPTLARDAGDALHAINMGANQKVSAHSRLVGRQQSSVASQVLIAGYIDGKADAVKISTEGSSVLLASRGEMFVGSGATQALTAWHVVRDLNGEAFRQPAEFRRFFGSLIHHVGLLGGDAQTWIVTEHDAVELPPTASRLDPPSGSS